MPHLLAEPTLRYRIYTTELLPGDVIVSFKKPKGLFAHLANSAIVRYQNKLYPNGNNEYNHIRVYLGNFGEVSLVFEYTTPVSKVSCVEDWMLLPDYAHIYRSDMYYPRDGQFPDIDALKYALINRGRMYDYLQLLGIGIGWNIGLGKDREVCSTGARKLFEYFTGTDLFPVKAWRTPPSAWANDANWHRVITKQKGK